MNGDQLQRIKQQLKYADSNDISSNFADTMEFLIQTIEQQKREIERYKRALESIAFDADVQFFERCPVVAKEALGNKR